MLRFPILALDHDDTIVQSEKTINFPYFQYILDQFRPGTTITLQEYMDGCFHLGFADMCRQRYHFTEQELVDEFEGWKTYVRSHIPTAYPGIKEIIQRKKALGGKICVISHSSEENIRRDYLTHFGIEPDDIFGWDLPETLRKPNPYPLEEIIRKYACKTEEILVVDDMKTGYDMAAKASVPIAFAGWGRKNFPEICQEMQNLCDYAFYSIEELEHFLFDDLTDMV